MPRAHTPVFNTRRPTLSGIFQMAMRNYRQAKRNREDSRKKRQQEKLERKQKRVIDSPPAADADAVATPVEPESKESP